MRADTTAQAPAPGSELLRFARTDGDSSIFGGIVTSRPRGQPIERIDRTETASVAGLPVFVSHARSSLGFGGKPGGIEGAGVRLPSVVAMAGAGAIEAGAALVGAGCVSGAQGGDKDGACAQAGLDAVGDTLGFRQGG